MTTIQLAGSQLLETVVIGLLIQRAYRPLLTGGWEMGRSLNDRAAERFRSRQALMAHAQIEGLAASHRRRRENVDLSRRSDDLAMPEATTAQCT